MWKEQYKKYNNMIATLPNTGEQDISEKYLTSKPHTDVVVINGNVFFDIDGVILTAVIGWLLGKRKASADARSTEMDSVDKAITIWRELAQDFKTEVEELRVEVSQLREENNKLTKEVNRLIGILESNGIVD